MNPFKRLIPVAFTQALIALLTLHTASVHTLHAAALDSSPVKVTDDGNAYVLANGIVTARIDKHNGRLVSFEYKGIETIGGAQRGSGYWSHTPGGENVVDTVTIDPKANDGARGEVSVKGVSGGNKMGNGPGGSTVADIEIRFALDRGVSGVYTYTIFDHKADYPATSVGEARFCAKLNDEVFDWMTVDANRNMKMITTEDWDHGIQMNLKEARRMTTGEYKGQVEHKYDYSANQFETPAWGWSSTTKHIGLWFINPTVEYLSGGPTKVELSAHRDATFTIGDLTAPAPPCLLNYWRGSHYGGSRCEIAEGEAWTKVVGPFLIYCNSGPTPEAMWKDALAQSTVQTANWPFDWVTGVDYPHKAERATVTGDFAINDPQLPDFKITRLLVGLSHPDYTAGNNGSLVDWQQDAKHYQFWVRGNADGTFSIPNVRPGAYTLHAIADGILGEYAKTDIKVEAGKPLDLGKLKWTPVRYGQQVWDIGIPNRKASEFFKGDDYFHWGWYLQYPKLFPHDVNYVVGKSDFRKDWFFEQVPHAIGNDDTGKGKGAATTWSITFNLPRSPRGVAIFRAAIAGIGAKNIAVKVNGKDVGSISDLTYNATINRDGIGGLWAEHDLSFNSTALKSGQNVMTLTIPEGGLTSGILYDYLRLEVNERRDTIHNVVERCQ